MSPIRDEELIRDPVIRRAVETRRAAEPPDARLHRWPIGWLLVGIAIGVLLIVVMGLMR
jgi:hypothetical protein